MNEVLEKIDVNSLERIPQANGGLELNAFELCDIELSEPVVLEDYQRHPGTGSFILIDKLTNVTVAAGMVQRALGGEGSVSAREYT